MGLAMTWGLVHSFGFAALAVCFALALGTLVFSVEPGEGEVADVAERHRGRALPDAPTTYMGGL